MTKPACLNPGDTIGIVSPSWGGAGRFPHRFAQGIKQITALGYQVKIGSHALNDLGFISDTPENRAGDINSFFADPDVRAIVAAIGGDHSCHLLPFLNFDLIHQSPKIIMGYSDITVLNIAIYKQTGLVTFNGPALLTDFAEFPEMIEYTRANLLQVITNSKTAGKIKPSPDWTEELLEWGLMKDRERPRIRVPSPGWTWLKSGIAEGFLIGGCIESLQHLRGTRYWPDWNEALFFWETSEDKPSPETIDGILMDYENMGILAQIRGMLVGRPMRYDENEKQALRDIILERTRKYTFPIISDMDFGHTSPQMTLPIGIQARIDSTQQEFKFLETAVS